MIRLLEVTLIQGDEDEDRIFRVRLELEGRETVHYRVFEFMTLEVEGGPRLQCLHGPPRTTYAALIPYIQEEPGAGALDGHPIFERINRAIMEVDRGTKLAFPIIIWEGGPLDALAR